jgi:hypothetical protein
LDAVLVEQFELSIRIDLSPCIDARLRRRRVEPGGAQFSGGGAPCSRERAEVLFELAYTHTPDARHTAERDPVLTF